MQNAEGLWLETEWSWRYSTTTTKRSKGARLMIDTML
nr:MAG TPA: hypothetical protein [Caudoviricetes sp.]